MAKTYKSSVFSKKEISESLLDEVRGQEYVYNPTYYHDKHIFSSDISYTSYNVSSKV